MPQEAVLDLVRKEVEDFLAMDVGSDEGLEILENQVRCLTRKIGESLLQHKLDVWVGKNRGGYMGQEIQTPEGVAQFERYESRRLQSYFGRLELSRAYYWRRGGLSRSRYAPLDQKLGLDERMATPALRRGLIMLGVELPFGRAERMLKELTGVEVSAKTISEATEDEGARIREQEAARAREAWIVFDGPSCHQAGKAHVGGGGDMKKWEGVEGPPVLYIQMDGGRVNTEEGWREPKIGVFFRGTDIVEVSKDRREILRKEYVGTMEGIEEFMKRIWETGHRWGAHKARNLIMLGDGAEGFQKRMAELFPEAIQILDWYHAVEHLWEVGRSLVGPERAAKWVKPYSDLLRAGKVGKVLERLRRLHPRRREAAKKVAELIGYYENNRERMKYDEFERLGYFIGSGSVESGVKNVVNMRMKGCGMIWGVDRADRMLHARATYLSQEQPGLEQLAA